MVSPFLKFTNNLTKPGGQPVFQARPPDPVSAVRQPPVAALGEPGVGSRQDSNLRTAD